MLARRIIQSSQSLRLLSTSAAPVRSRASSIPILNQVAESAAKTPAYLVQHPYPLDGYKETPNAKAVERNLFAVVDHSGTQYKVVEDDVIATDYMVGYEVGQTVDLDKVLMVGSKTATVIGKPIISGLKVKAIVEEIVKDKKVITLKFRRRKNSKNIRGFRRQLTILRVQEISLDEGAKKDLGV